MSVRGSLREGWTEKGVKVVAERKEAWVDLGLIIR